ncbi:MAG: 30S ribosomal protein S9 [Patescibacteria group bacterium]|nr:30S ribosomal protein S9 [Patescibacteria group bacterium]
MPKKTSSKTRKVTKKTKTIEKPVKKERYFEAVGRRKTAVARVRVFAGESSKSTTLKGLEIIINNKDLSDYFPLKKHQDIVSAPFKNLSLKGYKTTILAKGSGLGAQAEAARLGIARALILLDPSWRSKLKLLGFLKRDPRMVERKKYGLRKARRPQQWRKR